MKICQLPFLCFALFANSASADEWFLMARHGECNDIKSLSKREKILQGASNPEEIKSALTEQGIMFTADPFIKGRDDFIKLTVPSKNWGLLIVRKEHCTEFLKH